MSAARFVSFIMLVFVLCAMPFLLVQASGVSSAGLAAGFRIPLEQSWLLALFFLIGMCSAWLEEDGFILAPFATIMMMLCGASLSMMSFAHVPMTAFIVGGTLGIATAWILAKHRETKVFLCFGGTIGFHIGRHIVADMPVMASPLFYLLGTLMATCLCLAIAVAFGLTMKGERECANANTGQTDG